MDSNILDSNVGGGGLEITPQIKSYLKETAKWGKFLSIVGFIMLAISSLGILSMGTLMAAMGMENEQYGSLGLISSGFFTFFWLLLILLYIFPLLFLFRFSTKINKALIHDDQVYLSDAFKNLKSLYKFIGILMVIGIGFYVLIFIIGLLGGLSAMM